MQNTGQASFLASFTAADNNNTEHCGEADAFEERRHAEHSGGPERRELPEDALQEEERNADQAHHQHVHQHVGYEERSCAQWHNAHRLTRASAMGA